MYKEAWGLKRICPMCSKQYYDLGRTELECPECGKEIEVTTFESVNLGGHSVITFMSQTKTQQIINKISSKRGQDHATSRSFLLRQSAVLSLV